MEGLINGMERTLWDGEVCSHSSISPWGSSSSAH